MSAFVAALIACGWMGLVIGVFSAWGHMAERRVARPEENK